MPITVDRKLGLEYTQRQHPFATPIAEAHGMTQPIEQNPDDDTPIITDPSIGMVQHLLESAKNRQIRQPFRQQITQAGYTFIRPSIFVTSISNLGDNAIDVVLVEGESTQGPKAQRIRLATGAPCPLQDCFFNRAFTVSYLATTDGPQSSATLTVGGTWNAGQTYFLTITMPNRNDITNPNKIVVPIVYQTVAGDANNNGVATQVANAINANALLAASFTATSANNIVTITANTAGSAWNRTIIDNSGGTGAGNMSASTFAGAALPLITISGRSL
jgi:hypothetical protein